MQVLRQAENSKASKGPPTVKSTGGEAAGGGTTGGVTASAGETSGEVLTIDAILRLLHFVPKVCVLACMILLLMAHTRTSTQFCLY